MTYQDEPNPEESWARWAAHMERLHEQHLAFHKANQAAADRRWRRRFAALAATGVALIVVVAANAFPWGGQEWSPNEGVAFLKWQREHGSSGKRFARNHPELAATFKGNWPADAREKLEPKPSTPVEIIKAVFPDHAEAEAIAIARCETGGTFDPRASGDGGNSIGLFQINYVWWHLPWVGGPDRLVDPWHNSRVALRISGRGTDWSPWTCARILGIS